MRRLGWLLVILAGCAGSSEKKPAAPFKLAPDVAEVAELLHGSEREMAVRVERTEGFDAPVTLRAEVTPAGRGVTVTAKAASVVVAVSEAAQPGEYTVAVVGTAGDNEARTEVALRVPRKD